MKYIGSKLIETPRLLLTPHKKEYQKRLWEILMTKGVYDYYLSIPKKFKDGLLSWDKQEPFYMKKVDNALNNDIFDWCIILKENNECIGKIDCHKIGEDESIRDVGWYIDPKYQGKGYASEAAKYMFDYMFYEVDINKIETGANINNPASWKIMEKYGFRRIGTRKVNYTFIDGESDIYCYEITKEEYINKGKKLWKSI